MPTKRVARLAAWTREHPVVADGLLAVLLAVISLIALFARARAEGMPRPDALAVGLVLVITLPLAWRRRHPFWINMGVGGMSAVYGATPYPDLVTPVALSGVVALYSMVAWCGRTASMVAGAVTGVLVVLLHVLPDTDGDLLDFSFTALLLVSAWVLGDRTRIRRAYTGELEARAVLLARERDFEARRAVAAERARIARELHDVVAHHVSMMVVQAEAGPVVAEHDPPGAVRAFDAIAGTGRQALAEMRRLLGVLREETTAEESVTGTLAPQPGMAELPELVEQVRGAGLDTELEVEGDVVPLPAGVDLSAYRIVQEALTNVVKHAGGARARVRVRYSGRDLRIEVRDEGRDSRADVRGEGRGLRFEVRDDGRESRAEVRGDGREPRAEVRGDGRDLRRVQTGDGGRDVRVEAGDRGRDGGSRHGESNGSGGAGGWPVAGKGHGLIGMRERVHLYGGELTAGPRPDGGFAVVARLPIGGDR
ncbi:sensor histidine kinase [Nonomuraea sp. NN258]|uniref:sensor histidine kinase n=1 Tax=Nonomuraea antri TaxID=2730852 RepID=UPI0015691A2B|nr:histidine kinase [Nonomuraea antri]NRQ36669.1 sensor histidine kinase [Nonomuraea antri]